MESNGFTFEVIIPHIITKKECLDPRKITVEVTFHRIALTATSSRINISEFPDKPGFDFYAALEEIKYMVTSMTILFIVKYGDEILGLGETTWPQTSLTHIHSAMVEIFHVGQCDIYLEDQKVGCMEFAMRIRKHCDYFEKQLSALELNSNLRDLANREDILLMMANDPNFKCSGKGDDHNEGRHSEHRASGNEKALQKTETRASCADPRACEIAKLVEMLNQVGKPKDDCSFEPIECHDCVEGMLDTGSSDFTSSDDDEISGHQQDQTGQCENEKPCWFCPNDIPPPPTLTQTIFRAPRHCLICKQNMAWLPKFAACPNCGYKPMPLPKEVPYNDKYTANEVLEEYLQNASSCSESQDTTNNICSFNKKPTNKKQKCRCKCNNNKKCAFCRIQMLAEEIMLATRGKTTEDNDLKCGKCDDTLSNLFNTCREDDPNCRPFLARVFSELRLLYDVKPPKERKKKQITEFCEKQMRSIFQKRESIKLDLQKEAIRGSTIGEAPRDNQQKTTMPKDKYNQIQNPKQKNGRRLKNQKLR